MNSLRNCLLAGLAVRLGVIAYGQWHDNNFEVPFTDVDYKVFTDAARYVTQGGTPYQRHTYRYPPLLAWLLVPNIILHPSWGKILFSIVDILTGVVIHALVRLQGYSPQVSLRCAMVWVFNPLAVIIATRGNSDSIIAFTVLSSAFFLLKNRPILCGVFLALAIHIRLYPIMFSLPMYLAMRDNGKVRRSVLTFVRSLLPNQTQCYLVLSCTACVVILTALCYQLYGTEYLQESILYHLKRKDIRHNFSVYFYLLYLQPDQSAFLLFLPQFLIIIAFSFVFGNSCNILFCLFAQTFAMVSYNPVLTSQYFVWYLSLLPPILPRLKLEPRKAAVLTSLWVFAQLAWLVPAYLLEFRGKNTFLYIWFQGIGFFCANVAILVRLIRGYVYKSDVSRMKQD